MNLNKDRTSKNEYVEAALIDAPQDVVDELLQILGNYGFILDESASKPNPGRTWFMNNIHIQVINPNSYVEYDEIQNWVPGEMLEEIDELSDRSNCPITWNFGANINDQVTGGLDVRQQWVPDDNSASVLSADYGGAYDIDPEQYFTREDIVEFSDAVCDALDGKYNKSFEVTDTYMDTPTRLYISVSDDEGNEIDTFVDIDMRKIRRPADLINKYSDLTAGELQATYDKLISDYISSAETVDPTATYVFPKFTADDRSVARREYNLSILRESDQGTVVSGRLQDIQNFADEYLGYELDKEYLSIESASVSGAEGDRPNWWYEPDDYDEGEFEESLEIDINDVIVTVDYEGQGEWDVDMDSIEPSLPDMIESEKYRIDLVDKEIVKDELEECIYDVLPDESGTFHLSCKLIIDCYVTGLYFEQYEDDEVGPNTEDIHVEVTGSHLKNVKWTKID